MTFNLLPSKWLNKRNDVTVRREEDRDHSMHSLQNEMNDLFEDFFRAWEASLVGGGMRQSFSRPLSAVAPRIDVQETEKELLISAELPGLAEKDIDVSLSRDTLTISGEKRQESEKNIKGWHHMERSYGTFTRSILLPREIDPDSCNATFKNGVLTVSLAKTHQSEATAKSIPIKKA